MQASTQGIHMNKTQAIAKLRKIIGPRLAYRIDRDAPNAAERAASRAEWTVAKQAAEQAETLRKARYEELLKDPEYQRLKAAATDAHKAAENKRVGLMRHRITVGRDEGFCFSVVAQGDDWDEVVSKSLERA